MASGIATSRLPARPSRFMLRGDETSVRTCAGLRQRQALAERSPRAVDIAELPATEARRVEELGAARVVGRNDVEGRLDPREDLGPHGLEPEVEQRDGELGERVDVGPVDQPGVRGAEVGDVGIDGGERPGRHRSAGAARRSARFAIRTKWWAWACRTASSAPRSVRRSIPYWRTVSSIWKRVVPCASGDAVRSERSTRRAMTSAAATRSSPVTPATDSTVAPPENTASCSHTSRS